MIVAGSTDGKLILVRIQKNRFRFFAPRQIHQSRFHIRLAVNKLQFLDNEYIFFDSQTIENDIIGERLKKRRAASVKVLSINNKEVMALMPIDYSIVEVWHGDSS